MNLSWYLGVFVVKKKTFEPPRHKDTKNLMVFSALEVSSFS